MHNSSVLMASLLSLDFADDESVHFPSPGVWGLSPCGRGTCVGFRACVP